MGLVYGRSRSAYVVINNRETARTIEAMMKKIGDVQKRSCPKVVFVHTSLSKTGPSGAHIGLFTLNHSQVHILRCAAKKLGFNDFLGLHSKM